MSDLQSILSAMKKEDYSAKKQLLTYLIHLIRGGKCKLTADDRNAIAEFAAAETASILAAMPKADTYKEKDLIFECEDLLLGLVMSVFPKSHALPDSLLDAIQTMVKTVAQERYLETAVDAMFERDSIDEPQIQELLSLLNRTDDEYQKGKLYAGLVHYKAGIAKFSAGARAAMAGHLADTVKYYLEQTDLNKDILGNLELMADIIRDFRTPALLELLRQVTKLGHSNINFYALETLLSAGENVPAEMVAALAKDLEYANLAYDVLTKYKKQSLFPAECATEEYLAKSDLVHWLTYPTELGKAPDEIEYIGKITYLFKKDVYHVFRYRTDSDTLDDALKNKWLIGWSGSEGGTFSNFDEYALFDKGSKEATLKNIKKKLIG